MHPPTHETHITISMFCVHLIAHIPMYVMYNVNILHTYMYTFIYLNCLYVPAFLILLTKFRNNVACWRWLIYRSIGRRQIHDVRWLLCTNRMQFFLGYHANIMAICGFPKIYKNKTHVKNIDWRRRHSHIQTHMNIIQNQKWTLYGNIILNRYEFICAPLQCCKILNVVEIHVCVCVCV